MNDSVNVALGCALLLSSVLFAFSKSNRHVVLAILLQGSLLGVLYLCFNLEFLAILQWLLCILFSLLVLLITAEVGPDPIKRNLKIWMGPVLVVGGWVATGRWLRVVEKTNMTMERLENTLSLKALFDGGVSIFLILLMVFLTTVGLAFIVRRRFEGESL